MNVETLIKNRVEHVGFSCKSVIVTLFGDAISQHGGSLWLGSLISALAPLGFSERLVRTSVFRLVKDSWLHKEKVGRRSYYQLTEEATQHYVKAAQRIYAGQRRPWNGEWLIVFTTLVEEVRLIKLKRQLSWLGFAPLSSGTYAHPSIDLESLQETVKELGLTEQVIVFTGKTLNQGAMSALTQLVDQRWDTSELSSSYQEFIDLYSHYLSNSELQCQLTDKQQFLLRTLMIHEYRRILLKDHELPVDMLPTNWVGDRARSVAAYLYLKLAPRSCAYISREFENESGTLDSLSSSFQLRFG